MLKIWTDIEMNMLKEDGEYEMLYPKTSAETLVGILPVSHGGTGVTDLNSLKINMDVNKFTIISKKGQRYTGNGASSVSINTNISNGFLLYFYYNATPDYPNGPKLNNKLKSVHLYYLNGYVVSYDYYTAIEKVTSGSATITLSSLNEYISAPVISFNSSGVIDMNLLQSYYYDYYNQSGITYYYHYAVGVPS